MLSRTLLAAHLPSSGDGRSHRTIVQKLSRIFGVLLVVMLGADAMSAQVTDAHITVLSTSPARVKIEGHRSVATRTWSFRNVYGGMIGLGERIEKLTLSDARGNDVAVRKLASGEYVSIEPASKWSCEVNLDPPALSTDAAYISWITAERGFLMLGDLLPRDGDQLQTARAARVAFAVPPQWKIVSNEVETGSGEFTVTSIDDSVFYLGPGLRAQRERVGSLQLSVVATGSWAFSDRDVISMATEILKDVTSRVGRTSRERAMLIVAPFPRPVGAERWSAETRGGTVLILSGSSPSKIAAMAHLSGPLTHELFHLWVPNGLLLSGNYDWFYEGFTLYQALHTSVRLGFLTFQDYLRTLARAYDAYRAGRDRNSMSLLEASRRRWTGGSGLVYQKGMLVAFLYDLTLRVSSSGKRNLDDVYRGLFLRRGAGAETREGNEVVLALLKSHEMTLETVRRYIENAEEIDLAAAIAPFGLTIETQSTKTQISVAKALSRQQRDLLRAFGYNVDRRRSGNSVSKLFRMDFNYSD